MGIEGALLASGLIGTAGSLYTAHRSSQIAGASQAKMDEIADFELDLKREHIDLWRTYYKEAEIAHAQDVFGRERRQTNPDNIRNNALVEVRRAFDKARQDIQRCADILCVGDTKARETELAIAEANASIDASERAIRFSEARDAIENAKLDELIARQLQFGRGSIEVSNNAAVLAASLYGDSAKGAGRLAGFALERAFRGIGNIAGSFTGQAGTNVSVTNQGGGGGAFNGLELGGGQTGITAPGGSSFNPYGLSE